jgi:ribonuclease P protein component
VGFIAGRRIGNAVTRNRVKRRLRESLRSLYPRLRPGFDVVFIARPPLVSAKADELDAAVTSLLQRAGLLIAKPAGADVVTGAGSE